MFHVKHLPAERLEGSRSGWQDGAQREHNARPPPGLVTVAGHCAGTARSRPIQQVLEPGGDGSVTRDGDQVHALERSRVPDRQQQLASDVDPRLGVPVDLARRPRLGFQCREWSSPGCEPLWSWQGL